MAWLKEGDENSKLFHSFVNAKTKKNMITEIQNENGESLVEEEEVVD